MKPLTVDELRGRLQVVNQERLRLSHGGTSAAAGLLVAEAVISMLVDLRSLMELVAEVACGLEGINANFERATLDDIKDAIARGDVR